jgi:hypothetical protein
MLRPATLLLAALLSARSFWQAMIDHQIPLYNALVWFLIAVPVSGLMLSAIRAVTASYRRDVSAGTRVAEQAVDKNQMS